MTDTVGPTTNSGQVYVFRLVGSQWLFEQKLADLLPGVLGVGWSFGYEVALDGEWIAVGAWGARVGPVLNQGAAYIFRRNGSSFQFWQSIIGENDDDHFGLSIDIDDTTMAIAAGYDDHLGAEDGGSVSLFRFVGSSWVLEQPTLVPSDNEANDVFGSDWGCVDIDGDLMLVGAFVKDDGCIVDAGRLYSCMRSGGTWSVTGGIRSRLGSQQQRFAGRVRLKGNEALIGAYMSDFGSTDQGSAHVFSRSTGRWDEVGVALYASDGNVSDEFGKAVDFDDRFYFVGANLSDNNGVAGEDHGAVYIFRRVDCLGLPDCNTNLIDDRIDIASGAETDINDNLIPDSCEGLCALPAGDANNDGVVNFTDITTVLANYNATCP